MPEGESGRTGAEYSGREAARQQLQGLCDPLLVNASETVHARRGRPDVLSHVNSRGERRLRAGSVLGYSRFDS
jgi:hypothetical protein